MLVYSGSYPYIAHRGRQWGKKFLIFSFSDENLNRLLQRNIKCDDDDDMFSGKQLPLQGTEYLHRFRELPAPARANIDKLRRFFNFTRPAVWLDKLTKDQEEMYHFVSTEEGWSRIRNLVAKDVAELPAIAVAVFRTPGQTRPTYLTFSTYTGRQVTLPMWALASTVPGGF